MANEVARVGSFLISEAQGNRSRAQVTALALNDGATVYQSGRLVASVTKGAGSTLAGGANAGNGTVNNGVALTANVLAGSIPGAYRLEFIGNGTWVLTDPAGKVVGYPATGVAWTTQVGFTATAGGNAWAVGDFFTITVAAGSGKMVTYNPAGTNGSETPIGILYNQTDVSGSADVLTTIIARSAEVIDILLNYNGADNTQKAAANAVLLSLGILVRSGA